MRNVFALFLAEAGHRRELRRRLICVLCVLSLLVSTCVSLLLTLPGLTASLDPTLTGGVIERVTDNPTHNGWIRYFGANENQISTEFAGGVWMDKSVFDTTYVSSTGTQIPITQPDGMLGVLSVIGSSQAITGRIYTPTDVMLILDMSSSMYPSMSPTTVQAMVTAVNNSITTLQSLNKFNRVGVTIYYGGGEVINQSTTSHGYVMLPLDRYTPVNGKYITAHVSSSKLTAVRIASGVTNSSGKTMPTTGHNVASPAGTYAQLGILHAMDQFLAVPESDLQVEFLNEMFVDRQPVFVFMSDGQPTAATANFATKGTAQFGNNQVKSRSPNETDFVTQLTAAYAKEQVGKHYGVTPLYYTLGLGTDLSYNIMDPANNTTSTINGYWNTLVSSGSVTFQSKIYPGNWTMVTRSFTAKKTNGFPSDVNQRLFVDRYFAAKDSSQLSNAFETIVNEIILKSMYSPTHTDVNHVNQTGEVSFLDVIGEYMTVTEVKGILIGGSLYTGLNLARNFVAGGVNEGMGSFTDPTDLGWAFHLNVMEQLGLSDAYGEGFDETSIDDLSHQQTTKLIRDAYTAGQLKYNSDTDFSNYIGWYADDANNYLGFWDGTDPLQDPARPYLATQVIKSYFYQGVSNSENNYTLTSDMMYATVWVRRDIETLRESVVFSVPAGLLPTLKYYVNLSPEGELESMYLGAPNKDQYEGLRPIRLVYEVGLREDITAANLTQKVSAEYLNGNSDFDTGEVYFYSNEWERDHLTGYGKSNTYAYFQPSRVNDRYYYTVDAPMYQYDTTTKAYTPYTGAKPVKEQDLFTLHIRYVKNVSDPNDIGREEQYYMPASDTAVAAAVQNGAGQWYVPAGTIHDLPVEGVNQYASYKTSDLGLHPEGDARWQNLTDTLPIVNEPFADSGARAGENATAYVLGATLGNNGRITVVPDGQTLQKRLVDTDGVTPVAAEMDQSFTFLIHEGEMLTAADQAGQPVAFDYSDGAAVSVALAGRKVSMLTLTVTAGNSYSGIVPLANLTEYTWQDGAWHPKASETEAWNCIYAHTYTIVELDTNDRFDLVSIGGTAGAYQFQSGVYASAEQSHTIVAINRFVPWKIQLTKVDNFQNATRLSGAVFGLYSPKASDGLGSVPEGIPGVSLTETYGGQTWYLAQIGTTDDTGGLLWEGLKQEQYLLLELQAPPGYYPATDRKAQVLQRNAAPDLQVYSVTVTNDPGLEMPSTGSLGSSGYICIGSAIMLISAAAMFVYIFPRKEELASP